MEDPNKKGDDPNKAITDDIASLKGQIDNLNKGIASYRDEAKAARLEAEKAKGEVAELKGKIEFSAEPVKVDLHPDDEKKLKAWAESQGFVTEQALQAERQRMAVESLKTIENTAISEFLGKHPELAPEDKWAPIKAEFSLYKQPTTIEGYRVILNRITKDLGIENKKADDDAVAKAKALLVTKSRLGLGGGSQMQSTVEQDIDSLQLKYPNLSREVIEARISELRALNPDKK